MPYSPPEKVSNDNTDVKDVEKNDTIPQIRYDITFSEKHNKYQTFYLLKLVQLYLAILILVFEIVQVFQFEAYFQDFKNSFNYSGPSASTVYFHQTPFGKGPVAIWNYVAIVSTIVILGIYLIGIKQILPYTKHVLFIAFERFIAVLWIVEAFCYLVWAYNIEQSPCYSNYPVYYYTPTSLTKVLGSSYRRQIICGAYITATTLSWFMLVAAFASTAIAWFLHDSLNAKLSWPLFISSALIPTLRDIFYTPQPDKLEVSPPLMGTTSDEVKRKTKKVKSTSRKTRNSTSPRATNPTTPRSNDSKSSQTSDSSSPPSWIAPAVKMATNIASHITPSSRQNNDNNNNNNNKNAYFEIISNVPAPQHETTTSPIQVAPNTPPKQDTAVTEQSNNDNVTTETANNNTPPTVDNDKATQQTAPAQSNDVPTETIKNDPPKKDENTGSQTGTAPDTSSQQNVASTVNNDTPTQQKEEKTPEKNNDEPVETAKNATPE